MIVQEKPRISVVLPVHNGMPFLPQAVDSILAQSFPAFELNVIDDGSTDDTPAYLRAQSDRRIHYHRLEKVGFSEALNYGIGCSSAPLIARMDGDDVAEPQRFSQQLQYLEHDRLCILVGCQSTVINAQNETVKDY